jgi:hypothetical protein
MKVSQKCNKSSGATWDELVETHPFGWGSFRGLNYVSFPYDLYTMFVQQPCIANLWLREGDISILLLNFYLLCSY